MPTKGQALTVKLKPTLTYQKPNQNEPQNMKPLLQAILLFVPFCVNAQTIFFDSYRFSKPPDTTPPSITSAVVTETGQSLVLTFSEAVHDANHEWLDLGSLVLTVKGTPTALSYVSGDGTDTITFELAKAAVHDTVCLLSYSSGEPEINDLADNSLADFSDLSVDNLVP
jgi:hypothetical protein